MCSQEFEKCDARAGEGCSPQDKKLIFGEIKCMHAHAHHAHHEITPVGHDEDGDDLAKGDAAALEQAGESNAA